MQSGVYYPKHGSQQVMICPRAIGKFERPMTASLMLLVTAEPAVQQYLEASGETTQAWTSWLPASGAR